MKLHLGLRALALLAFVAVTTAVIVEPGLIGGPQSATLNTVLVVGHA